MKVKKLVLAKTGIFNGQELILKHLQQMVDNFSAMDAVPLCFGHYPQADMPKLGQVIQLWTHRNLLCGKVELHDKLAQAFDEGLFDAWSIGAHKDSKGSYYLHHVAILGEEPPSYKNLKSLTRKELGFAASDIPTSLMYFTENLKEHIKEENLVSEKDLKEQIENLHLRITALEEEVQRREEQIEKMSQTMIDADRIALQEAIQAKLPEEARKTVNELADVLTNQQQALHLSDQSHSLKLLKRVFDFIPAAVTPGRISFVQSHQTEESTLSGGVI